MTNKSGCRANTSMLVDSFRQSFHETAMRRFTKKTTFEWLCRPAFSVHPGIARPACPKVSGRQGRWREQCQPPCLTRAERSGCCGMWAGNLRVRQPLHALIRPKRRFSGRQQPEMRKTLTQRRVLPLWQYSPPSARPISFQCKQGVRVRPAYVGLRCEGLRQRRKC